MILFLFALFGCYTNLETDEQYDADTDQVKYMGHDLPPSPK